MAVIEFTKEDVGKQVVDASGTQVGQVVDTRGGTAYVDPNPDMVDTIRTKLGWGNLDEDAYPLDGNDVEEVTDSKVQLAPL